MAKLTIEIDDDYAGVLSVTAIGSTVWKTLVSTTAIDLSKCCSATLCKDGKWILHDKEAQ